MEKKKKTGDVVGTGYLVIGGRVVFVCFLAFFVFFLLFVGGVGGPLRPQPIELDEAPVVKKDIKPLPRQKFSLFMLAPDLIIPPTGTCLPVQVAKLLQIVF